MSIAEIETLITETQTLIDEDNAIVNTIGSMTFGSFNRNGQNSGENYIVQIGSLAPFGLYTGSFILEAQISNDPTTQTNFCFVEGGYLNLEQNGDYISTIPNLYFLDSNIGPFGTYQQLFFSALADASGMLTFNYKFVTKQANSGTATSTYNVNQNNKNYDVYRICRIR